MTALTQQQATGGQIKQINRVISDAAENAVADFDLDEDGVQRVHSSGDELAAMVGKAITAALVELSVTDQFKSEERQSSYTYPETYTGPKPIAEQLRTLTVFFPKLDISKALAFSQDVLPTLKLPKGAEGWFAVPRWQALDAVYNGAFGLVLQAIGLQREFTNHRKGELGPDRLRQHARTAAMLDQIAGQQEGDVLIIPLQLGMGHRGRSVRRAREVIACNPIEFGGCPFIVGCVALTHPERYDTFEELDTDCPGGEYAPEADGVFSGAPFFYFHGRLKFGTSPVGNVHTFYGSVSGFLPQTLEV